MSSDDAIAVEGHNASSQKNVAVNPDPALDRANEHEHRHFHHTRWAAKHLDEDREYTIGTSADASSVPNDTGRHNAPTVAKGQELGVADAEKGSLSNDSGAEVPKRTGLAFYLYKYKILLHLFIWLLFTG